MSFSQQPLENIIPAYLYAQYSDDVNLQAFIDAYNGMVQAYLNWFNDNPLGIYTNPNMTGDFLNWIGLQLYGIPRPVVGSVSTLASGYYGSTIYPFFDYAQVTATISGTAQAVSDDIYKRVLTWFLYLGDGKQMSIPWIKRRFARFLYGPNGTDITASELSNVSITQPSAHTYNVVFPASNASTMLIQLVNNNVLALPFQITFSFQS